MEDVEVSEISENDMIDAAMTMDDATLELASRFRALWADYGDKLGKYSTEAHEAAASDLGMTPDEAGELLLRAALHGSFKSQLN